VWAFLLVVFRTNVGWKRWDEARKAWGVIVNHSRNLLRQGCSWVSEETEPDPEIRKESLEFFCNSVWSFSRSMQRHLWGLHEDDEAFQKDVRDVLDPFEAEGLIAARHKPTRANHDLSRAINQLPITYLRRIEMDKSAIEFANAMGACDRIFTSPVPLFYTRHAARFLGIWLLALPLGLWGSFDNTFNHLPLIPASAIIAFFFFGIEELSIQLEEPFSVLPLDKISGGIKLSAKEHMDWYYEHENDRAEDGTYHSRARILE
jgi:predicted membrane chloride channel (bestrophin family)